MKINKPFYGSNREDRTLDSQSSIDNGISISHRKIIKGSFFETNKETRTSDPKTMLNMCFIDSKIQNLIYISDIFASVFHVWLVLTIIQRFLLSRSGGWYLFEEDRD